MTTIERKFNSLLQEVRELKARMDTLVPIDTEGEYKKSFTETLARTRKSKNRFSFKKGLFTPTK